MAEIKIDNQKVSKYYLETFPKEAASLLSEKYPNATVTITQDGKFQLIYERTVHSQGDSYSIASTLSEDKLIEELSSKIEEVSNPSNDKNYIYTHPQNANISTNSPAYIRTTITEQDSIYKYFDKTVNGAKFNIDKYNNAVANGTITPAEAQTLYSWFPELKKAAEEKLQYSNLGLTYNSPLQDLTIAAQNAEQEIYLDAPSYEMEQYFDYTDKGTYKFNSDKFIKDLKEGNISADTLKKITEEIPSLKDTTEKYLKTDSNSESTTDSIIGKYEKELSISELKAYFGENYKEILEQSGMQVEDIENDRVSVKYEITIGDKSQIAEAKNNNLEGVIHGCNTVAAATQKKVENNKVEIQTALDDALGVSTSVQYNYYKKEDLLNFATKLGLNDSEIKSMKSDSIGIATVSYNGFDYTIMQGGKYVNCSEALEGGTSNSKIKMTNAVIDLMNQEEFDYNDFGFAMSVLVDQSHNTAEKSNPNNGYVSVADLTRENYETGIYDYVDNIFEITSADLEDTKMSDLYGKTPGYYIKLQDGSVVPVYKENEKIKLEDVNSQIETASKNSAVEQQLQKIANNGEDSDLEVVSGKHNYINIRKSEKTGNYFLYANGKEIKLTPKQYNSFVDETGQINEDKLNETLRDQAVEMTLDDFISSEDKNEDYTYNYDEEKLQDYFKKIGVDPNAENIIDEDGSLNIKKLGQFLKDNKIPFLSSLDGLEYTNDTAAFGKRCIDISDSNVYKGIAAAISSIDTSVLTTAYNNYTSAIETPFILQELDCDSINNKCKLIGEEILIAVQMYESTDEEYKDILDSMLDDIFNKENILDSDNNLKISSIEVTEIAKKTSYLSLEDYFKKKAAASNEMAEAIVEACATSYEIDEEIAETLGLNAGEKYGLEDLELAITKTAREKGEYNEYTFNSLNYLRTLVGEDNNTYQSMVDTYTAYANLDAVTEAYNDAISTTRLFNRLAIIETDEYQEELKNVRQNPDYYKTMFGEEYKYYNSDEIAFLALKAKEEYGYNRPEDYKIDNLMESIGKEWVTEELFDKSYNERTGKIDALEYGSGIVSGDSSAIAAAMKAISSDFWNGFMKYPQSLVKLIKKVNNLDTTTYQDWKSKYIVDIFAQAQNNTTEAKRNLDEQYKQGKISKSEYDILSKIKWDDPEYSKKISENTESYEEFKTWEKSVAKTLGGIAADAVLSMTGTKIGFKGLGDTVKAVTKGINYFTDATSNITTKNNTIENLLGAFAIGAAYYGGTKFLKKILLSQSQNGKYDVNYDSKANKLTLTPSEKATAEATENVTTAETTFKEGCKKLSNYIKNHGIEIKDAEGKAIRTITKDNYDYVINYLQDEVITSNPGIEDGINSLIQGVEKAASGVNEATIALESLTKFSENYTAGLGFALSFAGIGGTNDAVNSALTAFFTSDDKNQYGNYDATTLELFQYMLGGTFDFSTASSSSTNFSNGITAFAKTFFSHLPK